MNKKVWGIILCLLFFNILSWAFVFYFSSQYLEVTFFNIGQGDAIFIETPNRHQILIDGGPNREKIIEKLLEEMPFWDKTIDLVVLTHTDKDHLNGILQVLKDYEIENILWTGIGENEEWDDLIHKEGANILNLRKGSKIIFSNVLFEVLNPDKRDNFSDNNDASIVLKMNYIDSSFLFTGDLSSKKEDDIGFDVDVLKVAHHGSRYSTSSSFLERTSPELAIIQVGKNSYGHPSEDVLTRLLNSGIKTLRTDINGDIKIVSDGKILKIITKN
jgi:competence protein ComEC